MLDFENVPLVEFKKSNYFCSFLVPRENSIELFVLGKLARKK